MRSRLAIALALIMATGAASVAADRPGGYLAPGELSVTSVLEPAPRAGDPRYETDRKIFRATRALIGTPRYKLATADAELSPASLLRDYSCAVGVTLTPQNAPKLAAVVQRAGTDTGNQSYNAKEFYKRERPYVIDHGTICQPESELYDSRNKRVSYDYPSGHSTLGWTWALVLASIAPDRTQPILERGRAYADSRFVCGAHNESAVEAGMFSASVTMAVVQTKAPYQADLAARAELAALRAQGGPPPAGCAAEAALVAERVMPSLK